MKKLTGVLTLLLFSSVLLLSYSHAAKDRSRSGSRSFARGQLLVKFREDVSESEKGRARKLVSGRKGRVFRHVGVETLRLPSGWDEEQAVDSLSRDPAVVYAELDRQVKWLSAPAMFASMPTLFPADPGVSQQWYLDSSPFSAWFATSSNVIDVDVDIDAPEGWAVMSGFLQTVDPVTVGVVDSGTGENGFFNFTNGYEPNHVDLPYDMIYKKESELTGTPGVDDDGNGLIDDISGYDWYTSDDDVLQERISHTYPPDDDIFGEDNVPADVLPEDEFHGTFISGIIAAQWNGAGVAGIGNGKLLVLPLRATLSSDIVGAFDYAIETSGGAAPVKVVNASWEFDTNVRSLEDAVKRLQSNGIALVAAAGNDSNLYAPFATSGAYSGIQHIASNDDFLNRVFPAEYTRFGGIQNVLTVTATGTSGSLSDFSNIGPGSVQIAAPGELIYNTAGGTNGYDWIQGTSFSAPIAGSVMGLLMAAHPGMQPAEAINRVVEGGDFDARLAGLVKSGKRVNLAGALAPFAPYSGLVYLDSTAPVSMYDDTMSASYGTMVSAVVDPAFSTSPDAAIITASGGGSWAVSALEPGIAQFTLYFDGVSAPVSTYDTGPWRVTAIYPFSDQIFIGGTTTFQSLFPPLAGAVSWSVMDTAVADINNQGVLTGKSEGWTKVTLSLDGVVKDRSGWILVQSSSAFIEPSNEVAGCGGCGTTKQPGDPDLSGLLEMMLVGMMLVFIRWRHRVIMAGSRIPLGRLEALSFVEGQNPISKN